MKTVEVTSGHILHDNRKYEVGDNFVVSDGQAESFEILKVAKIIDGQKDEGPEEIPVFIEEHQDKETTEKSDDPAMSVDSDPFVKPNPQKKREKRKRG